MNTHVRTLTADEPSVFENPPGMLDAIERLLKESIHPEVRRYLRGLYLDLTNQKVTK